MRILPEELPKCHWLDHDLIRRHEQVLYCSTIISIFVASCLRAGRGYIKTTEATMYFEYEQSSSQVKCYKLVSILQRMN